MKTLNIYDYQVKANVAKVLVSYTGDIGRDDFYKMISQKMKGLASPVHNSFRKMREGIALGFLRANREVRVESDEVISKRYKNIASANLLMDKQDDSLWSVEKGTSGKFLTRHGDEDLASLIQKAGYRRPELPRLSMINTASVAQKDFVAFVSADNDVDHGFVLNAKTDKVDVVSFDRLASVTINPESIISVASVDIPEKLHALVSASLTEDQKKKEKDYWTQLYGYGPDFLRETIKQVDESTFA